MNEWRMTTLQQTAQRQGIESSLSLVFSTLPVLPEIGENGEEQEQESQIDWSQVYVAMQHARRDSQRQARGTIYLSHGIVSRLSQSVQYTSVSCACCSARLIVRIGARELPRTVTASMLERALYLMSHATSTKDADQIYHLL